LFVQDFMIVERPCRELVDELLHDTSRQLGAALGEAESSVEGLRGKVGPGARASLLSKTVEIRVGRVRRHSDVTVLSFGWRATGAGCLFPRLDGDFEMSPLGADKSQLALRGSYEPPGGPLGRSVDRFLLHRLAEATVRAFLSSLADRMSVPTALAGGPGS
jgi:hypothetical protein